ncbi:GNAT family N-acetyltransferase [Cognatishimia sp. F0-27]|uniref:GNAT family N-acetyltransferase n=1 Tax=Cognatishimia sp. F0-27 TaxID=2816855 RepID=UPI001D0C1B68|nr:GNAT family N-acetyltransferase [Cognatishimia sp. F0-27]MCC1491271.1 GNAT family N-acetyltransferase [Cognatishimia sp. F0-27]
MQTEITIRPYAASDAQAVTDMLIAVFRAGDTYTIDPDITPDDALRYWTGAERRVFVAESGGVVLGTYYIVRNQKGGGSHVCNCGYVTAESARGRGIARAMLAHSLDIAPTLGFRAMQYNFVVATNTRAVATWERAGFAIVGRLPKAFRHPQAGYVDALVMYRDLITE